MQKQPNGFARMTNRTQALGAGMRRVVERGGVLYRQDDGMRTDPLQSRLVVRLTDSRWYNRSVFNEAISCLDLSHTTAGLRNRSRRLLSKCSGDQIGEVFPNPAIM